MMNYPVHFGSVKSYQQSRYTNWSCVSYDRFCIVQHLNYTEFAIPSGFIFHYIRGSFRYVWPENCHRSKAGPWLYSQWHKALFSHMGELGLRHKSLFLSSGQENSMYQEGNWQYLARCIRFTWKQRQMTLPQRWNSILISTVWQKKAARWCLLQHTSEDSG